MPASDVVIRLWTVNPLDALAIRHPATVVIPIGSTTAGFLVEGTRQRAGVVLHAEAVDAALGLLSASFTFDVTDPTLAFVAAPYEVDAGETHDFMMVRPATEAAGTLGVTLASADTNLFTVARQPFFMAGATSAVFRLTGGLDAGLLN